ncbi:hypothetical protein BDU57DRAFT_447926, partial [Ampelomyces quisqualis]
RDGHEVLRSPDLTPLRPYDCRGPMGASRGTKDARSSRPATTTRGQRGSK